MTPELNRIYQGDVLETLRSWPDGFINTCVTSPPYWGLRDYGVAGQIGLEKTPEEYTAKIVEVFKEVKRILRDDGTLWLNLGDCYNAHGRKSHGTRQGYKQQSNRASVNRADQNRPHDKNLKPKDLAGIPWRVAFALQADGWYLRSDIIWAKPNPMPESVRDRPTRAHEYIFFMAKSKKYYYDSEAIRTPIKESSCARLAQDITSQVGSTRQPGKTNGPIKAVGGRYPSDKQRGHGRRHAGFNDRWDQAEKKNQQAKGANKRTVWTVAPSGFKEAHFATFPPKLVEPCILAGAQANGIVLDPFMGAGTTALVALKLRRQFLGCELNQKYIEIAEKRIAPELEQRKLF
jgi:DNA modification methylase